MAHLLKDLLGSSLRRNGIHAPVRAQEAVDVANDALIALFGRGFERRARAKSLEGDTLVIEVNSAVVACELRFQEVTILARLRQHDVAVARVVVHLVVF